mgnify:CR=1 FL=1
MTTDGKCPPDVIISVNRRERKMNIDGIKKGYDFIFAFLILYGNNKIANNDKYEYIDIPLKMVIQITPFA